MYADGGIAEGGTGIGTRGVGLLGWRRSSGAAAAGGPVVIYNVANMEEAVQQGYNKNKGHILNQVLAEAKVGGKLRNALRKTT